MRFHAGFVWTLSGRRVDFFPFKSLMEVSSKSHQIHRLPDAQKSYGSLTYVLHKSYKKSTRFAYTEKSLYLCSQNQKQ